MASNFKHFKDWISKRNLVRSFSSEYCISAQACVWNWDKKIHGIWSTLTNMHVNKCAFIGWADEFWYIGDNKLETSSTWFILAFLGFNIGHLLCQLFLLKAALTIMAEILTPSLEC